MRPLADWHGLLRLYTHGVAGPKMNQRRGRSTVHQHELVSHARRIVGSSSSTEKAFTRGVLIRTDPYRSRKGMLAREVAHIEDLHLIVTRELY